MHPPHRLRPAGRAYVAAALDERQPRSRTAAVSRPNSPSSDHRRLRHRSLPRCRAQARRTAQGHLHPRSGRRCDHHHGQRSGAQAGRCRFAVVRLLQVGDERVRRQLRLRAARPPADVCGRWRTAPPASRSSSRTTAICKRSRNVCKHLLPVHGELQRPDLGGQAGPAAGRHQHREGHPQRACCS